MEIGKFYLVPVPIGNLDDITMRSLSTLKEVDVILAEDTRTTALLLSKYSIKTKLMSYHQHNERSRVEQIIEMLDNGQNIALVSDAGMPCISDPGAIIVQELVKQQIQVIALPGANAALTALIASGLNTDHHLFFGFLEGKGKIRSEQIQYLSTTQETFILYEAPHRLLKTLEDFISSQLGNRKIAVGRELTKRYENYFYGTIIEAFAHYQEEAPRGEFVLVIEGYAEYSERENLDNEVSDNLKHDIQIELQQLLDGGMKLKSASNYLSTKFSVSKNEIYQMGLELK